jgi:hypothetical protein
MRAANNEWAQSSACDTHVPLAVPSGAQLSRWRRRTGTSTV